MRLTTLIFSIVVLAATSSGALRTPRAASASIGVPMAVSSSSIATPQISIKPQLVVSASSGSINLGDGGSATLEWTPSDDDSVVGYRIHWGIKSGTYTNSASVGNVTNATIRGLLEGTTYYFAATAHDADGVSSVFSNEATSSIPFRVYSGIAAMNFYGVGRSGATNVLEWSTNTINWNQSIVWKGNGKTTNLVWWMTNAPQAFIRIRAK